MGVIQLIAGIDRAFWAVVLGMCLFTLTRDADRKPFSQRATETVIALLLGIGAAEDVAASVPWLGETAAAALIIGFGVAILDTAIAMFADRERLINFAFTFLKRGN